METKEVDCADLPIYVLILTRKFLSDMQGSTEQRMQRFGYWVNHFAFTFVQDTHAVGHSLRFFPKISLFRRCWRRMERLLGESNLIQHWIE
jgi:hypothetical protein